MYKIVKVEMRKEYPEIFVGERCMMIVEGLGGCEALADVKAHLDGGFIFLCNQHFKMLEASLKRQKAKQMMNNVRRMF